MVINAHRGIQSWPALDLVARFWHDQLPKLPPTSSALLWICVGLIHKVGAEPKYNNRTLDRYVERSQAKYKITVVERPAGVQGLVHLPYRWVVERTNAWNGKYRRNSKDYERTTSSSEAKIKVSTIHLMLIRQRYLRTWVRLIDVSPYSLAPAYCPA